MREEMREKVMPLNFYEEPTRYMTVPRKLSVVEVLSSKGSFLKSLSDK